MDAHQVSSVNDLKHTT